MQFHLDGFVPGDPDVRVPADRCGTDPAPRALPETCDVLIVGCGPAGLALAAQLAQFPGIDMCIVEQKSGRLLRGQADGIACRTMEMFNAFGFVERVMREAYWVNETAFWRPDAADPSRIVRSGRVQDVEDGLSEFPHVILNQARVHDFFLDVMRRSPSRLEPHYARRLADMTIDTSSDATSHPVTATFEIAEGSEEGRTETIRARYAVGCDGARSAVRRSIGRELKGDSANQAWGVMDVLVVTDFPDIRLKAVIQSAGGGTIVLIPREGGYLVRVYVELDKLDPSERVANRNMTVDHIIAAARKIMHPWSFDVKEVAWWSIYEIGQRVTDKFDDVPKAELATRTPRIFIAGDACHTHSPKAGQGMNVSMQDAFNLGWKLAGVLAGRSAPSLLHTYSAERQAIAKELIDFDREWAALLHAASRPGPDGGRVDAAEVQRYFVQHGRYTAGTATRYAPALLTATAEHQDLARGFVIGTRFHSAPVVCLGDAKPIHLGHTTGADGRWRLFAFADRTDPTAPAGAIRDLCHFLADAEASPVRRYTPAGADIDAEFDVRAVFQQPHRELAVERMPAFLLPRKGRLGLIDYEKMFCPDLRAGQDIFDLRGIARDRGCLVVVRPDQYVADVMPLDAFDRLAAYFERILIGG